MRDEHTAKKSKYRYIPYIVLLLIILLLIAKLVYDHVVLV